MTPTELRAIIQSDFKLWEHAETTTDGATLTKTMELPYNIGAYSLSFTGVNDAQGRRSAAEVWARSVRDVVENAIGEDAVTARAAQRAARVGPDDGEDDRPRKSDTDDAEAVETSEESPVSSFSTPATFSANPSRRLDELREARDGHRKAASALDLEIAALTAYMEVMNAQEVSEETAGTPAAEDQEEVS